MPGFWIRHTFTYPIRIPKDPDCELMQDSNLEKDVEVTEVLEVFFGAVGT